MKADMCGLIFKKNIFSVTFCFFLFSFYFSSCGLETLYYLEPPTNVIEVNFGNEDREKDVLQFYTGDNSSIGDDFDFDGTEVYYKIFDSESSAKSSYSNITSRNSSSDISAAASYIINTLKYVPLISDYSTEASLTVENQAFVKIRLNSYGSEYPKEIEAGSIKCSPRRYFNAGKYGFEFSREVNTDSNPIPKSGDEDVSMSSSDNSDGEWYVDLWAFSAGKDSSFTPSYSRAVHLGCIKILESYYTK